MPNDWDMLNKRVDNRIGAGGAKAFGDVLKTNCALTELFLSGKKQLENNHLVNRVSSGRKPNWTRRSNCD